MAQATSPNTSSSATGHDRPERSRNAKAQARHRAKRKAYIEQLEQTVTKLQTALALSPEQVAALPPPTLRIRQLEQENTKLLRENDELRRQLHMQTRRPSLMTDPHFDIARRGSFQSSMSSDYPDRDLKRRRLSQNVDGVYLSPSQTPSPPTTEALARPTNNFSPPPLSHGYVPSSTNTSAYSSPGSNTILSSGLQGGPLSYQLPAVNTPSSASTPTSYSQSGNEHPSHPLVGGHGLPSSRSLPSTLHSAHSTHGLSAAHQYPSSHYDSVKVEEDYMSPTQESSHSLNYSPIHSFNHPHSAELSSWQSYSADRTQIHP
ncbi:hypothetical protein BJV74DRAFT_850526 [Russula compacta]|nr:hypothetical protein BJV74DRAFT_850526 [Russula compacta]